MKCVVLCAGYATRLHPLTKDRPKPLLPVGGIPLLERIVTKAAQVEGMDRIYVVTNHRFAPRFEDWAKEAGRFPVEVIDDGTESNDDRLGAIGDLDFAVRRTGLDDELLVLAGDNLLLFDLDEFVRYARPRGAATCLKDLKNLSQASMYGVVQVDRQRIITGFEEKPARPKSSLISIGVYFFPRDRVRMIRTYLEEGHVPDQPGRYLQWLHKKIPVYGYVIEGQWFDIGDLDSYRRANEMLGTPDREGPKSTT